MRKFCGLILFILAFSFTGWSQNSGCLKTNQFYIQNYLGEPYFKKSYLFTQYADSSLLFDSLKVIDVKTAVKKACSVRGFKIHWITLILSKDSLKESYWEMHNEGKEWLVKDAPRKYRKMVGKTAYNGIGVVKIIKVNAITGEIFEIREDVGGVVIHIWRKN